MVFTKEAIIFVTILAVLAFVFAFLTLFFFICYKRTPRGKGYMDVQNEDGRKDSVISELTD